MSLLSTKIKNSITLKPGEQFTLPPGATLIAATDSAALSSTCGIPQLESFKCYVAMIAAAGEEGNTAQYYESGGLHIRGYRLNGVDIPFTTDYAANDEGLFLIHNMVTELKQRLGGMISQWAVAADSNNERGSLTYIVIKTLPSIGDNLGIWSVTNIPHDGYNQEASFYNLFHKYEEIDGKGYVSLPPCPSN